MDSERGHERVGKRVVLPCAGGWAHASTDVCDVFNWSRREWAGTDGALAGVVDTADRSLQPAGEVLP